MSEYVVLRIRAESSQKPLGYYFDLSGGYYWFSHYLDSDLEKLLSDNHYSLTEVVNNSWGWAIGTGVRYKISNTIRLSAGFTQNYIRPRYHVELINKSTHAKFTDGGNLNMDWFSFQGAISIRFTPFEL